MNPAETEFLLIGLPAQLTEIHNPTLTIPGNTTIQPVFSARNLGNIFDSNLSFSDHIDDVINRAKYFFNRLARVSLSRGQTSPFSVQTVVGHYNCCTTIQLWYCSRITRIHPWTGADQDYPIEGAQIFHPVGCILGGQLRAQSARELRAKPEPRAKPKK